MNRYVKLFLVTSIPFGILNGLLDLNDGWNEALLSGIISGVFFGIGMTLTLGIVHKTIGKNKNVKQEQTVVVDLPYDQAFDLCLQSLENVRKSRLVEEDRVNGKIVVKVGLNWATWGDKIIYSISKMDDNQTEVNIVSYPIVKTTLIDYGKNAENISLILRKLK